MNFVRPAVMLGHVAAASLMLTGFAFASVEQSRFEMDGNSVRYELRDVSRKDVLERLFASQGIAIFTEPSTQAVIRLRLGEAYGGWILQSVRGREASLGKGGQVETVALPRPGESVTGGAR